MTTLTETAREELLIVLRAKAPELEEDGPFESLNDENLLDIASTCGLTKTCEGCNERLPDTQVDLCTWDRDIGLFIQGGTGYLCEECKDELSAIALDDL